jgi:TonB dependent receptor
MRVLKFMLAGALIPVAAGAADWELNPKVEAGYLFDDNYRLAPPGAEIEVQGPLADAELEMRARTLSGEFSFTPRVRATYFPDEQDLDTVDYFGTLDWLHNGQRLKTRVRGDFSHQDVVNSEQPDAEVPGDADLGEADMGDAGLALVKNRRMRASLRPTFEYELSARRGLEFGANFADVSFDNEIPGAQVDYRNADITAGLVTRFTPITSFTTRLRGAHYDIDTLGDSNSYGVELEWDTRTAAEKRTFLRVGAQNVELVTGGSEVAWLAGAGVSMPLGRNQLFADLSRSVGPSSAGIIVARDQVRLRWTYDMTPRLSLLAGVRGTHDDDVDQDSEFRPRSYATGDVGLQWRLQEVFSLRVAYDYTWQEFDDALTDAAKSSGATLSFLYQPVQRRR